MHPRTWREGGQHDGAYRFATPGIHPWRGYLSSAIRSRRFRCLIAAEGSRQQIGPAVRALRERALPGCCLAQAFRSTEADPLARRAGLTYRIPVLQWRPLFRAAVAERVSACRSPKAQKSRVSSGPQSVNSGCGHWRRKSAPPSPVQVDVAGTVSDKRDLTQSEAESETEGLVSVVSAERSAVIEQESATSLRNEAVSRVRFTGPAFSAV